jgi:hypothetical protein
MGKRKGRAVSPKPVKRQEEQPRFRLVIEIFGDGPDSWTSWELHTPKISAGSGGAFTVEEVFSQAMEAWRDSEDISLAPAPTLEDNGHNF